MSKLILPNAPKEKLDMWFRSISYELIHYWTSFAADCYYIVCGTSNGVDSDLHFIRIFKIGDRWELSQDHTEST